MSLLIAIILSVFGVLQVILFFKLWGMTNDVKKIEQRSLNNVNAMIKEAKIYYLKGNIEKVEDILNTAFYSEFLDSRSDEYLFDEFTSKFKALYSLMELEMPDVEATLAKIGKEKSYPESDSQDFLK